MSFNSSFFTKSFSRTLAVIRLMASPEGTTINEITQRLSLTRRSVFRLLRFIEQELHIPATVERKTFGGPATYHLQQSFVDGLSVVKTPPMTLTFEEAVTVYILSNSGLLPKALRNKYNPARLVDHSADQPKN